MSSCPFDPRHLVSIPAGATREFFQNQTRRQFFGRMATGLGGAALATLAGNALTAPFARAATQGLLPRGAERLPHLVPKAKRAIYLFMGGAPSQVDMFDYKPQI